MIIFIIMYLTEIIIYPIKSLGGISLKEAKISEYGIENDRKFMLLKKENGNFIT